MLLFTSKSFRYPSRPKTLTLPNFLKYYNLSVIANLDMHIAISTLVIFRSFPYILCRPTEQFLHMKQWVLKHHCIVFVFVFLPVCYAPEYARLDVVHMIKILCRDCGQMIHFTLIDVCFRCFSNICAPS